MTTKINTTSLTTRLRASPTSHIMMEAADGIDARDVEIERLTNNRDMWRGQCERQAAVITAKDAEIAKLKDALAALAQKQENQS